ncbi:hypothetical protein PTTG_28040 [Puccinia triticina 1-1 BBBD Race 1]|uniref:Uncharacterized protein n=1 Tax=Puccinia triticina (isolate 1-1 / race 1 (BBBD)) TaxID=630390 RepID=A0A180GFL6_PUCT1|nr:hypothetical protein PTTG_28040 [Puccinia triticina 1-1 BBBD Race 1]
MSDRFKAISDQVKRLANMGETKNPRPDEPSTQQTTSDIPPTTGPAATPAPAPTTAPKPKKSKAAVPSDRETRLTSKTPGDKGPPSSQANQTEAPPRDGEDPSLGSGNAIASRYQTL